MEANTGAGKSNVIARTDLAAIELGFMAPVLRVCPHCKGLRTFLTRRQHPRGPGVAVPCSKCRGLGTVTR